VKRIALTGYGVLKLENLTGMKAGSQRGNLYYHWSYDYIQKRIRLHAERHDVRVALINPAYTSQTCSRCGVRDKKSRIGEIFTCRSCGVVIDADLNGAVNISHR